MILLRFCKSLVNRKIAEIMGEIKNAGETPAVRMAGEGLTVRV